MIEGVLFVFLLRALHVDLFYSQNSVIQEVVTEEINKTSIPFAKI